MNRVNHYAVQAPGRESFEGREGGEWRLEKLSDSW